MITGIVRCIYGVLPVLLTVCLTLPAVAEDQAPEPEEHVLVLKEYRYVAVPGGGDELTGFMLCKNRCHALSVDYLNYTTPGGWYLQRVADNKEVTVDLDNPFMKGQCVCVADEFVVKVNDLYMVKPQSSKADK